MVPPLIAVAPGVGVATGAVVGVVPLGADVAGAVVAELLVQAVTRTATASNEPRRFISTSLPYHQSGNRQQPRPLGRDGFLNHGCEDGAHESGTPKRNVTLYQTDRVCIRRIHSG